MLIQSTLIGHCFKQVSGQLTLRRIRTFLFMKDLVGLREKVANQYRLFFQNLRVLATTLLSVAARHFPYVPRSASVEILDFSVLRSDIVVAHVIVNFSFLIISYLFC